MNTIATFINPNSTANMSIPSSAVAKPQDYPVSADIPNKEPKRSLLSRISSVAVVLFKAIAATALYWVNPSLFALSFIVGIVYDKQADEAIKKISRVWSNQPWIGTLIAGIAGWLSLPVTLAAGSVLMGVHIGSSLSLNANSSAQ